MLCFTASCTLNNASTIDRKILFLCQNITYSATLQNSGDFIDNSVNRTVFNLSDTGNYTDPYELLPYLENMEYSVSDIQINEE